MDLLRLILLVLLGFLTPAMATPAMATVSSEMTDVVVRDMDQDLNDATHSDAAHSNTAPSDIALNEVGSRGGLGTLLSLYSIQCGLDPNTPHAPGARGRLRDRYCRDWFQCKSDGKTFRTKNGIVSMADSRQYRRKVPKEASASAICEAICAMASLRSINPALKDEG